MKMRLAWIADHEYSDSYAAKETRVILKALARKQEIVAMWLALGSTEPPHHWHGIRVFPIPSECLASKEFLVTLIHQLRPHVIVSNFPHAAYPAGMEYLSDG